MKSCIYRGQVWHRRHSPKTHYFKYDVFMMYIDLDELPKLFNGVLGWSAKNPALAWFRRKDFLGESHLSVTESVKKRIHEETGNNFDGSIRLLANLRYFGYLINPLACYYCFDRDEQLQYIVAEVTNTPWKESHSYVLSCNPKSEQQRIRFSKVLHVSPFNLMDVIYEWRGNSPGNKLNLHLSNWVGDLKQFEAGMSLQSQALTSRNLQRVLWRYPFMTLKVAASIYWQALKLYFKGVPFVPHPNK